jgi:serine/threonine-protein kinase
MDYIGPKRLGQCSGRVVRADENLYLVDFGLASCRQLGTAGQKEKGAVMGTPAYMPTEQARGEINRVGPWSDQYGAGAVLFHMLTGALPYQDANPYTVIRLHFFEGLRHESYVAKRPEEWNEWVGRFLAKRLAL